jgi:hypothetical protein
MFIQQCFSICTGHIASRESMNVKCEVERGAEVVMSYITVLSSIIFLEGLTKTIDVLGRNTETPVGHTKPSPSE